MTFYHSKYYANFLTLRSPKGSERIGESILNATIDLNPHQVEAALFYFQNPLSKGVILADEVGLGKTIEAGLILCQLWSEHKRRILLIVPAALRKQRTNELLEKFFLPSHILDGDVYKQVKALDNTNPFDQKSIVICSYHFAAKHIEDIQSLQRDVAVLDEAHKLRNVYKDMEKEAELLTDKTDIVEYSDEEEKEETKKISMSKKIKDGLANIRKILLTATPLQNSLLELYGLASYLDEYLFGDLVSFKEQYTNKALNSKLYKDLQDRLNSILHRTLRRQVQPYIKYTNRRAESQKYEWNDEESKFYNAITDFLQTSPIFLMWNGNPNFFLLLIYRKIMASSTHAIIGTLYWLKARLEFQLKELIEANDIKENRITEWEIVQDVLPNNEQEIIDEDMLAIYKEDSEDNEQWEVNIIYEWIKSFEAQQLATAIKQVDHFIGLAKAIKRDTKAETLLKAIKVAYEELGKLWARRKILIFTESRRTQQYLFEYLSSAWYKDKIILFNWINDNPKTQEVYKNWKSKYGDTNQYTWVKSVDVRSAIVDCFEHDADIMIATESAAEWINLQFCSLVINYDLPWNPQRVEQRIWRCHRYGQEFDVIVMNLLNTSNWADERVYELLKTKFLLFDGMFGASDEILGQLEWGLDIEKRIFEIYQHCRTKEEIDTAFSKLEQQMEFIITSKMADTKKKVLEKLDQEVAEKLKDRKDQSSIALDKSKKFAWNLLKNELVKHAEFDDKRYAFQLHTAPKSDIQLWEYGIINGKECHTQYAFRTNDVLWEFIIQQAKERKLWPASVAFDISNNPWKISVIEQMKNKSGYLQVQLFRINAYQPEEYFLYSCLDESWKIIDPEIAEKLLQVTGKVQEENATIDEKILTKLNWQTDKNMAQIKKDSSNTSHEYFSLELTKLDKRANDLRVTLEKKVKNLSKQINEKKSLARRMKDLMERLKLEKQIAKMETNLKVLRRKLYDEEDSLEKKKLQLIKELEAKMEANYEQEELFTIKWTIV